MATAFHKHLDPSLAMNPPSLENDGSAKVVATKYTTCLSNDPDEEIWEVLPRLNQDIINIMALPGSGTLVREARAVVLTQFVLFDAIMKARHPTSTLSNEHFELSPTPVHFNLEKDTLHINHFQLKQNSTGICAILEEAIEPIVDNPEVPVSFCWTSFMLAADRLENNKKLALFALLLRRTQLTAIIYTDYHPMNRQMRIGSGLFGPDGEVDKNSHQHPLPVPS